MNVTVSLADAVKQRQIDGPTVLDPDEILVFLRDVSNDEAFLVKHLDVVLERFRLFRAKVAEFSNATDRDALVSAKNE